MSNVNVDNKKAWGIHVYIGNTTPWGIHIFRSHFYVTGNGSMEITRRILQAMKMVGKSIEFVRGTGKKIEHNIYNTSVNSGLLYGADT